ncbi:hypothetical protein KBY29_14120 [Ruegeria pomeroyi]|nr:hypothetical protein [Ruegeria pomeroyi]
MAMLQMTSPLHVQAAAYRLAGYAISNQLRVMHILSRAVLNAPLAQVQALRAAASAPASKKKPASAKTVSKQEAAGEATEVTEVVAKSAMAQEPERKQPMTPVAAAHPAPRRRRKPATPAPLPVKEESLDK